MATSLSRNPTSASPFKIDDLIASWCVRLASAFGRNVRDSLVGIWQQNLRSYSEPVLTRAFTFIERNDEKFPSVSRCLRVCRENTPYKSESNYEDKRRYSKTVDKAGTPVIIDMQERSMMYRAADCPEGRAFLEKLKSVSTAKEMSPAVTWSANR